MSFELVTEPIDRWPDPDTRPRQGSQFTATYDQTIDLLRSELAHLGAKGAAVIQVVTQRGAADLRRDGLLRARAVIDHPGVRLSVTTKHGPLTYSTDAFEQRYYNDRPPGSPICGRSPSACRTCAASTGTASPAAASSTAASAPSKPPAS